MQRIKWIAILLLFSTNAFSQNAIPGLHIKAAALAYKDNKVDNQEVFSFKNNHAVLKMDHAGWQCVKKENAASKETVYDFRVTGGAAEKAGVAVSFLFDDWSKDNYVIIPGAAYNGNRFDVLKYPYPPLFKPTDYKVNMPITITDVPRLNKYDGESRMDLNTGDMSTPAIGIYFPKTKKGIWILTEQATELGNSLFSFKENDNRTKATFTIAAPCVRELYYSICKLSPSTETGVDLKSGDKVTICYKVYTYNNLSSPKDLNDKFLSIRKSYGTSAYINQLPFSKAFEIMETQQNNECWDDSTHIYTFGKYAKTYNMYFQLGWVGGCMVTYPLSLCGSKISKERSFENLNQVIGEAQSKSGFYYSCFNGNKWCSDCFWQPHPDNLLLLRKDADALYFIYKYCLAQRAESPNWQMPANWKEPMRKFADAFVTLWKKYGQFGQFIDIETGEIKVGGSSSAVMAIGGLALASKFENRPELLTIAKQAARYYYKNFTLKGISCGGPGEILQNNDSESSFAMLESFVTLYEITGEKEWLKYAEDAAAFCSTWVASYDYHFPENSLFGKLNMKSTGAVWASTQNKHGGPGICTLSGDCLLQLYRATGRKVYIEMLKDIAHNIMQYISRDDRKIGKLKSGCVNERVNLSDWEGKDNIGGIFDGNTWAQVSAMLTVAEVPGIYINTKSKELVVFDQVNATLKNGYLTITNSTKFDADVSVFVDKHPDKPYPQGFISNCPKVLVKAGETIKVNITANKSVNN